MSEPFFHTDCPSCGAPVHAHSPTSVTLVCGYCNSMLVRQDGGIIDKGRDSALLEDFSPLQIGTRGRYGTAAFNIIGRLQMHYDAGVWNEWHILFDEGGTGWLSESGDIYSLTRPQTESALRLPPLRRHPRRLQHPRLQRQTLHGRRRAPRHDETRRRTRRAAV